MKKVIIANHVSLSGHRPWQREDDNFFASSLERFSFVCDTVKKNKASLVLTGHVFGRLTNPQVIQVIKELPKQTFVVAEKLTPVLSAMDNAGFIQVITPDNPLVIKEGITLAIGNEESIDDELKQSNTVLFTHKPANDPVVGAIFQLTDINSVNREEMSLPNAIRLFPGDEHSAKIQSVKLTGDKLSLTSIDMPFNDESFLSKVTEKTEAINNNLAMTNDGATSEFASLLKEHGDKVAAGEISDVEGLVAETRTDDQKMECYIDTLYQDAKAQMNL